MTDTIDRLKTALADRYTIKHELGAGGMATLNWPVISSMIGMSPSK